MKRAEAWRSLARSKLHLYLRDCPTARNLHDEVSVMTVLLTVTNAACNQAGK